MKTPSPMNSKQVGAALLEAIRAAAIVDDVRSGETRAANAIVEVAMMPRSPIHSEYLARRSQGHDDSEIVSRLAYEYLDWICDRTDRPNWVPEDH